MKKYLITSATAFALLCLFTSCSHDIEGLSPEESVTASYEKAFITAFGQPAPDQTWGFGSITPKASTRATEAEWTNTSPVYAKSYTSYLNPTVDGMTTNQISVSEMQSYTTFTDSYIETNSTLTNPVYNGPTPIYLGDGTHFRVDQNTEITKTFHVNGTYGIYNDVVIYVEGKMHLNGNTLNGPTIVVANGGEVVIDGETNMSNAGRIVVLGGGKISGADGAVFRINNGNPNYNAGTITLNGELNVNGSDFYNCGTVTVDVLRNTSGGKFTNFGRITARTNTVQGDAYNSTIINACYLHFTENAGVGPLTLLNNSRIDVDGQLYMTGSSTLYTLSEINAGSIYCQNAIIQGPTGHNEFAVVKTSKVLVSHGGDLTISNRAYFDMNPDEFYNYNNQRYKDIYSENDYQYQAAAYIINNNISHWANEEGANLYIPKGDCTGTGYNDNDEPTPTGEWVRVVAEDLTASAGNDFDFNDVVFDVKLNNNPQYVEIVLRAAGGTLPLYIGEGDNAHEVHAEFGQDTGIMINTGGSSKGYANCVDGLSPEGFALPNPLYGQDGYDNLRVVAKAIKVVVMKNVNGTSTPCELKAEPGEPTAKLCVGTDFKYEENGKEYPCLTERTGIKEQFIYHSDTHSIYNGQDKFSLYVKDIFGDDWYQTEAQPK